MTTTTKDIDINALHTSVIGSSKSTPDRNKEITELREQIGRIDEIAAALSEQRAAKHARLTELSVGSSATRANRTSSSNFLKKFTAHWRAIVGTGIGVLVAVLIAGVFTGLFVEPLGEAGWGWVIPIVWALLLIGGVATGVATGLNKAAKAAQPHTTH